MIKNISPNYVNCDTRKIYKNSIDLHGLFMTFILHLQFCGVNPRSFIICEGKTSTISCEKGKTIDVLNASYGRLDSQECPYKDPSGMTNTNCRSRNSLEVVQKHCNGKTNCSLLPNESMFGDDPCHGTYKYLEVKYRCIENIGK